MARARSLGRFAAGALALWLVALVIGGLAAAGVVRDRVAARLGDSLRAQVAIADASLGLVRGRVELAGVRGDRTDAGALSLRIARVRCELLPLGLALASRDCRDLVIEGVRLELSSMALLQLRPPRRTPVHAHRVEIRDAALVFSPGAIAPGLGAITLRVDRAVAGPTTFKSPLSWVFGLRELRARLALPAGLEVVLEYQDGVLTAAGSILGSDPVRLPVALPVADAADDARAELGKLVGVGRDIAQRLVTQRAGDWLRSKLGP